MFSPINSLLELLRLISKLPEAIRNFPAAISLVRNLIVKTIKGIGSFLRKLWEGILSFPGNLREGIRSFPGEFRAELRSIPGELREGWPSIRRWLFGTLRKLAMLILVVWTVVSIVTVLIELVPGDPATAILGDQATPEQVANFNQAHGLDKPPFFEEPLS